MFADLKLAARTLIKTPGFTVVAVLTLALGIGAVTAVFSLMSQVLLRPLPYPDAERLVVPLSVNAGRGIEISHVGLRIITIGGRRKSSSALRCSRIMEERCR